jgi:hypothetical protein
MINFILCHGEIQIFIILIRSNNIYELTEISCKENILIWLIKKKLIIHKIDF